MDKKQPSILTIEIGTSATKIICFDFKGNAVFTKIGAYPTFHPFPDRSEQDPEQVYITVMFLLKGILNNPQFTKRYEVLGISISGAMHSVLPVDKNGDPLGNAIIWSDNRASKLAQSLKESELGNILYERCGTPIHAMSPLSKIKWYRENEFENFKKTAKFISLKEYIIYQFTGAYIVDFSLASATGYFNLKNKKWDEEALSYLQVDKSYFSEPVSIYYADVKIKDQLLNSLKLDKDTKLIIGSSDGCMASISTGIIAEDVAVVSVTSSGAVRVFGKESIHDKRGRFFNYMLDSDLFISGGPTNNGGVALEWVAKSLVDHRGIKTIEESLVYFQNEAEKVKVGAEGLIFLPYIQGERAPIWNSNARGSFFGLNITHEPKHIIRAVIEGILFEIYSIANAIKEHRNLKSLQLNGYYASHPLWSSIICNLFGLPVNVSPYKHSSNLGAAMVGLTSLGVYEDLNAALSMASKGKDIFPDLDKTETYSKYYSLFEKLTFKLMPEFDEIAKLQNDY